MVAAADTATLTGISSRDKNKPVDRLSVDNYEKGTAAPSGPTGSWLAGIHTLYQLYKAMVINVSIKALLLIFENLIL